MTKLNLVPNEIVGYRIHPDKWNWTVFEVKKHGQTSKYAGEEYLTPLSYPANVKQAVEFIVNRVASLEVDKIQSVQASVDNAKLIEQAFDKAKETALWALKDLEKRLKDSGMDLNNLHKKIHTTQEQE